jgi:Leucine-rich repeat (LRR) protein
MNTMKSNLTSIRSLVKLRGLIISSTHIQSNIDPLSSLVNLEHLNIADNDGIAINNENEIVFQKLHKLENFRAKRIKFNSSSLSFLCHLKSLKLVELKENSIKTSLPSCLGKLDRLTSFEMYHNQMTGSIHDSFKNLKSLKILGLTNNKFNGPIDVVCGMENLEAIYLANNNFSGTIPSSCLSKLRKLDDIHLSKNSFYGNMNDLGQLTKLTTLSIYGNRISGELKYLSNLVNLKILDLRWNNVEGTLDSLCPLTKLQLLLLEKQQPGKSIHGQIPTCISDMPRLQILALGDNKLFGQVIPELLCHSKYLFLINLTNNLFNQTYTNYPSCFPSYYPLNKAVNDKGFTFNFERFHLHKLPSYFFPSSWYNPHKIRLQKLGMYWEPSRTCSNYITSAIECKKAAEANKPFDANNGYWGDHRTDISNLYHNTYYRPPGCFQYGGNGQYEFNKWFLSNVECSSWYKCVCAPSPNCSSCGFSNSSLPYKKNPSDYDYNYYWSKIFGQYNKDWYGNDDQKHILKAHRFLNGWPERQNRVKYGDYYTIY